MLAVQRKQTILEYLEKEGTVRTMDLAKRLDVADETIRRDLDRMAAENLVQRTHGGATRVLRDVSDAPYDERSVKNIGEKKAIAREALSLVTAGETIYIDASTTTLQFVQLLGDKQITVITNSHLVTNILCRAERIRLVSTGGNLNPRSYGFEGPAALRTVERYRIDKVFCSGRGIHATYGLTESNEWQATLKEAALARSPFHCFLADSTKIGAQSTFRFGSLGDLDYLVTTENADTKSLQLRGKVCPTILKAPIADEDEPKNLPRR